LWLTGRFIFRCRLLASDTSDQTHKRREHDACNFRSPPSQRAQAYRTILCDYRAVSASIESGTDAPFTVCDERLGFSSGQFGKIVNVQITEVAKSHAIITGHLRPVRWTWGSNAEAIDSVGVFHC
jgi:hypothetical protein